MKPQPTGSKSLRNWSLLLLVVPFIATLYIPFYNTVEPNFFGIPFFFAYLLLWVPISAVITGIVYFVTK